MIYDVSHGDRCHLINGAVLELQVGAKLCALSNGLSVMFYYCLLCTQEGSPYVLLLSVMLCTQEAHSGAMPAYFRFLTIMAFHVFLQEQVIIVFEQNSSRTRPHQYRTYVCCGETE